MANELPMWQRPVGSRQVAIDDLGNPVYQGRGGTMIWTEPNPEYGKRRYEVTRPSLENLSNNARAIYDSIPSFRDIAQGLIEAPGKAVAELDRQMFTDTATAFDVFNTASQVAGVGFNLPAPDGAFRIFAGRKAKVKPSTFEQGAKDVELGIDNSNNFSMNRVWRGADGQPRFEIPDYQSTLKINVDKNLINKFIRRAEYSLEEVLHHPSLYEAYPELKDMKVTFKRMGPKMFGYQQGNRIGLNLEAFSAKAYTDRGMKPEIANALARQKLRDTLHHEIQHRVQAIEGFDTGASPDIFDGTDAALQARLTPQTYEVADKLNRVREEAIRQGLVDPDLVDSLNIQDVNSQTELVFTDSTGARVTAPASDFDLSDDELMLLFDYATNPADVKQILDDWENFLAPVTDEEFEFYVGNSRKRIKAHMMERNRKLLIAEDPDEVIRRQEGYARYRRTAGEVEASEVGQRTAIPRDKIYNYPPRGVFSEDGTTHRQHVDIKGNEDVYADLPIFRRRGR